MINSHDLQTARGEDLFGRLALFAQGAQAESVMALGQTSSGSITDQFEMVVRGDGQAESSNEKQLAGGRLEQIGAANDIGDLHGGIVHHHGELVGGDVAATPKDESAEVTS